MKLWQNQDAAMNVLEHEVQHAVQEIEGFAKGGNPSAYADEFRDALYNFRQENKEFNDLYHDLEDAFNLEDKEKAKEASDRATALSNKLKESNKELLDEFYSLYAAATNDPYKIYNNLAGETEARSAQQRIVYTDQQRRNSSRKNRRRCT